MRYTRKQKKEIAEYQGQRRNYRDDWSGRITKVVYLCKMCHSSKEYDLDDLEVDHIIPVSIGGPETLDNLQLLCPKHNKKKGTAIRIKGKLIRIKPRTVKKKASTVKRKTKTVKRKTSTTKRKQRAVKKKASTVKRKTTTAKRKSSTVKRKRTTTRGKSSSARRRGR
jgi:5-methylcytosine-specific restriction endonuclease McrA